MSKALNNYFVGDIQGCYHELRLLLDQLQFNPEDDCLWVCGDLISRGPDSLATLRFIKSLGSSAKVVLGNHDLHLFAVAAGLKRSSPKDLQHELLAAPDLDELLLWLRQQPLMRCCKAHNVLLSHAGFPPHWDLKTAQARTKEVADILQSDDYLAFCQQMYGEKPDTDKPHAKRFERATYTVNALTRMRYLHKNGRLELQDKSAPKGESEHCPWFAFTPHKLLSEHKLVFGHWAALLGKTGHANAIGLDLGCCWGGHLCIWHAETQLRYLMPAGGGQVTLLNESL